MIGKKTVRGILGDFYKKVDQLKQVSADQSAEITRQREVIATAQDSIEAARKERDAAEAAIELVAKLIPPQA